MNRSKKFLAMFLALAMIFTAIPMNALAAEVDVTDQAETILEEEGEKSTEDVSEGESEELITDSEESETTDVSEEALTEEQQEELLSNDTEDIGTRAQARAGELNTYTKITNGFSNTVKYMIVYTNYSNRSWALCWDGNKYTGIEVSPGSNGTLKVDAELGDKILFRNINNGNITSCFDDRVLKGKSNYDLTSNPGYNYGYLRRIQSYNNSQNIQVDGEYGSSKYLQYDNNRKTWKFNTSNGIISFYAREAKITYNYYVDGEVYSTNSETVPAQENYRISIPNELSSMEFQKMSINGTEYTSKQTLINISGDTVINYYFKAPEKRSLTIEFYQDDKMISGYPKDVEVYSGVAYKVTAPDTVKNMVFSKRVLNGNTTTREDFSVTISKDSKVQFYYINMSNNNKEADEKLYPDDTSGTNDYPNYPEQGSVNISKTASGDDFNGSGVAEVALGVTGVPIKKGVDIVIVFDTSNSMNENISGTRITKLASAKSAAETFVKKVFENNPDGSRSNNRVGLVTFGDFGERIYGLKNANGQSYLVNSINKLKASGGTNYDEAFSQAEFVLSDADEERDKMVVFMTDGAPWKYNGYEAQSYQGYLTNAYKKNVLNYTLKNADSVKAMKNTSVYTIGFGMSQGNSPLQGVVGFEGAECTKILRDNVASPGKHVDAENDTDLQNAFNRIADQVRKSATEAVVSDTLGEDFTLQTSEVTSKTPGAGTYLPTIKLTQYDTYTRNDIGSTMPDGTVITEKEVGMHKGTYTVLETVTFNASGTRATSDIKGSVMDGYGNINAEYFTYNKATSTFTWNIGTITEKEIVLSYYVYLKNSIRENVPDSERPVEGLYDTNKNAVLEYKNYLDHPCKQTFEKPKMPWGTAVVNYQYYLVNESGEPVNPAGEVVPPTFRYHVGDTKQYKIP